MCSNQVDLQLLQDIGIEPDISIREKKHSLKTVGLSVIACVRMRKVREAWAGSKALEESLLRKLDGMRKGKSIAR